MQNQSENRFIKIEVELINFIPAVDKWFGKGEQRVIEDETSN